MRKKVSFKVLSLCLVMLVFVSAFSARAFAVESDIIEKSEPMQIYVENTGFMDSTASVQVCIKNVPQTGISSGIFNVDYDSSKLSFKSLKAGDIVFNKASDVAMNVTKNGLKILYSDNDQTGSSHISKDGLFCVLEFTVVSKSGDITLTPNTQNKFYDCKQNVIPSPIFKAGKIGFAPPLTVTATPTIPSGNLPSKPINISLKARQEVNNFVDVYVENVPKTGLASCLFNIEYDTQKLALIKLIPGNIVANPKSDIDFSTSNNGIKIMYSDSEQTGSSHIIKDGLLCSLEIRVLDAEASSTVVALSKNKFYDSNLNVLPTPTFTKCTIIGKTLTPTMPLLSITPINVRLEARQNANDLVDIYLDNIPKTGFASGIIDVEYDTSKVSFVSFEAGNIVFDKNIDLSMNSNNKGLKILYCDSNQTGTSHIIKDGLFGTLKLKASESGTYSITASTQNKFYDKDVYALPKPTFKGCKINLNSSSIISKTPTPTIPLPSVTPINVRLEARKGTDNIVDVYLDNIPKKGFASGIFEIDYDVSKLSFSTLKAGDIVTNKTSDMGTNVTSRGLKVMYSDFDQTGVSHITKDGLLCTIEFNVLDKNASIALVPYTKYKFYNVDISALPTPTFKGCTLGSAIGSDKVVLSSSTSSDVKKQGDTVTVDINVDAVGPLGWASGLFYLNYDVSKLEFVSCQGGPLVNNKLEDIKCGTYDKGLKIMYSDEAQTGTPYISKTGKLCTLTFKVKNTCPAGTVALEMSTDKKFYDKNIEACQVAFKNTAKIEIGEIVTTDPIQVYMTKANAVKPGSTVVIDVMMKNIPKTGLGSCLLDIKYDTSKLMFKSVAAGDIVSNKTNDITSNLTSDGLKLMYSDFDINGSSYIKKDGVLCSLTFDVASNANDKIELSLNSDLNFYDSNIKVLPKPTLTGTTILFQTTASAIISSSGASAEKKPGDTFTMDLNMDYISALGLSSGKFYLNYDISKLEYVSCSAGPIVHNKLSDIKTNLNSKGLVILYSDEDATGSSYIMSSGTLCTLNFKIKSNCADGEILFDLNTNDKFYDKNINPFIAKFGDKVKLMVKAGAESFMYGDVNGDGAVRANDFAMVRDYVIGKLKAEQLQYKYALKAADVNCDGEIRANDFAIIRDYVIGKVEVLPYVK